MSWSTRFTNLGRFSPFGRNNSPAKPQVTDQDFSYITSEDLARHAAENSAASSHDHASDAGGRDDTLILRHQKVSYPLHFPAGSLSKGEVTVGILRIDAAKKLRLTDARRIQLVYKGKKLKDDKALACDEGLRSGQESVILCVVSDSQGPDDYREPLPSDDTALSGASDDEYSDDTGSPAPSRSKKKKKRGSRKKRGTKSPSGLSTPPVSSTQIPRSEYIGTTAPASVRPTEAAAKPSRPEPPTVQKLLDAIEALRQEFYTQWLPLINEHLRNPPSGDKLKTEHVKLSESVLGKIMLKLDGVQPPEEWDTEDRKTVRDTRKQLVKEVDGYMKDLDRLLERSKQPSRD